MEARKITVVSTKTQKKSVIMSAATTLIELKRDLSANNIDFLDNDGNEMAFYEGISKTELRNNESVLPHDVPYKGNTTNELVFMLTNTNKKIKSGIMSRAEIYEYIKTHNMQSQIVEIFGKNFTQCKTDDLIKFINADNNKTTQEHTCVKEAIYDRPQELKAAFKMLVKILYANDYIDEVEMVSILNCANANTTEKSECNLEEEVIDSPYDDDELEDIMASYNA